MICFWFTQICNALGKIKENPSALKSCAQIIDEFSKGETSDLELSHDALIVLFSTARTDCEAFKTMFHNLHSEAKKR